ncbi:MAG: precorrin-6A synthase (deacetylating) [Hyphomicrobium sp.]
MKKVYLIGMGSGDPEHLTRAAIKALGHVDVVLGFDKGEEKGGLADIRKDICDLYATKPGFRFIELPNPQRGLDGGSYESGVDAWHRARATLLRQAILTDCGDAEVGAFLVWGDPALYDSTMRVLDMALRDVETPIDYKVIPGVSSIQVLAAKHRIPLNTVANAVLITTGRKLAAGLPIDADSVVVMLDSGDGLRAIAHEDVDIFWGGNLGTPHEVLVQGRLPDVFDEIVCVKDRLRVEQGWVMDVYLLRRRPAP